MPTNHASFPAAFQTNDIIAVNGSPDRNRRGSLGGGFADWLSQFGERLMNGRNQGWKLVGHDRIASKICTNDPSCEE
jgi:hypothetical protein